MPEVTASGFDITAPHTGAVQTSLSNVLFAGIIDSALFGFVGNGSTDARAALAAADGAATTATAAIVLRPGVYSIQSDITVANEIVFSRGARLKPADGVTVHLAGGFWAGDYQHVFDLSAGGVVTGDSAAQGRVTPQHFGALGVGASNDDTDAINAALTFAALAVIRDEYASTLDVLLPPVDSFYHVTSDIIIRRNVRIEGGGSPGRSLGAVKIKFASTCTAGFWFAHPGGLSAPDPYSEEVGDDFYGAGRSVMRNLFLAPVTSGEVDFGIVHNVPVKLEFVEIEYFRLAGVFGHGQSAGDSDYGDPNGHDTTGQGSMYGNTNGSDYVRCVARFQTEGHGFVALGNNTQVMKYDTCDANGNKGAGFLDNSSVGNTYINCHTAQNSFIVPRNDLFYMCIKQHTSSAADEPGVGVNWRTYWVVVTATLYDAEWATDQTYRASGGINVVQRYNSAPTIIGHYSEGGIEAGIIPRGRTSVIGGAATGYQRVIKHPEFGTSQVLGAVPVNSPATWTHTDTAGDTYGAAIGSSGGEFAPKFLAFGHSQDDATSPASIWAFQWGAVRKTYELIRKGVTRVLEITGTGWSLDGWSGAGNVLFTNGLLLSGAGSKVVGMSAVANNAAITGTVKRGQIFFYSQPTAGGKIGAVVTTAGTVGDDAVVKEFGAIDAA